MSVAERSMGLGLRALRTVASSPATDRVGLRTPLERLLFRATRDGFRTATVAGRAFTTARKLTAPARQRPVRGSGLFDLTLTDEQALLEETFDAFAAEVVRPAAAQADAACAIDPALRAQAAELGAQLLAVPEELDGALEQRSAVTTVLVAEALATGDPGIAAALLAPSAVAAALSLWGDDEQQSRYLTPFAGDEPPVAALAMLEPGPLFDPFELSTTATPRGDGWTLQGTKALVPHAAQAELLLVAAHVPAAGPAMFLVESGAKGLSTTPEPAMGLRATGTALLDLDGVRVGPGAQLGGGAAEVYAEAVHRARLAWCAIAVGGAQAVLDYVIPYVKERRAFGEPIAHRQAVAFAIADISIELEAMRMATWRAASLADRDRRFAREAALAWALSREQAPAIGSAGVQLLGGHGYVKEHPVERWYRDLSTLRAFEGALLV